MSGVAKETTPLAPAKAAPPATPNGSAPLWVVASACSFYILCSCSMLPFNKLVVTFFYDQPLTVVGLQMATACVLVSPFPETFQWGSRADVIRWSTTIPWFFVGMLATSMFAVRENSLGAVTVMRNAAPFVMIPLESIFNSEPQRFDWQVLASLGTILTGVIMYMLVDVSFSLVGVLLIVANTALAICDRLFQRRLIAVKPVQIPKLGMVFLNNSVGLGPLALLICAFREPGTYSTTMPHAMGPWLLLFSSAAFGTVMGWSSLNAQQYISATAHMVMTNMNKFLVIGFGMIFLGESKEPAAYIGCTLAILGGCWFAAAKTALGKRVKAEQEAAAAAAAADTESGKEPSK